MAKKLIYAKRHGLPETKCRNNTRKGNILFRIYAEMNLVVAGGLNGKIMLMINDDMAGYRKIDAATSIR